MSFAIAIDIGRPAGEVFAYVSDFENNPRWQRGMQSVRWTSPPPFAVGSTYEQVARFLGREMPATFRVTAFEPGRRMTIASETGPLPITVTRSVEPLGPTSCRYTEAADADPPLPMRLAAPLVRRSIRGDQARLKRLLEDGIA